MPPTTPTSHYLGARNRHSPQVGAVRLDAAERGAAHVDAALHAIQGLLRRLCYYVIVWSLSICMLVCVFCCVEYVVTVGCDVCAALCCGCVLGS